MNVVQKIYINRMLYNSALQSFRVSCKKLYRNLRLTLFYILYNSAKNIQIAISNKKHIVIYPAFDGELDNHEYKELLLYIKHYLGHIPYPLKYWKKSSNGYLEVNTTTKLDSQSVRKLHKIKHKCLSRCFTIIWKEDGRRWPASIRPDLFYTYQSENNHGINEWLRLLEEVSLSCGDVCNDQNLGILPMVRSCAVLGTGPSLKFFFGEGELYDGWIGANSVCLEKTLLNAGKPLAVCFLDPFLFSPLLPAQESQRAVCDMISRSEVCFVTAYKYRHYIKACMPSYVITRTAFCKSKGVDSLIDLYIKRKRTLVAFQYGNVLTDLMLPVAAYISQSATLYGCDGRPRGKGGSFPKYESVRLFDKQFENEINRNNIEDPYTEQIERFYKNTQLVVNDVITHGLNMSIRAASYNTGLCSLPVRIEL